MIPLFRFIFDLERFVFPPFCLICKNELRKAQVVCNRCFDKIHFISRKKCKICSKPLKSGTVCGKCKKKRPYFDSVISCGSYTPPLSDIIKVFKYQNRPSLSQRLARVIYSNYNSRANIKNINYLTWVPMQRAEIRERGYNHSKLLALELSKISSLKSIDLLYKKSNIPSQTTLPYEKRFDNVKDAYEIRDKNLKEFKGNPEKGIIIIDDVLTTGSTLNECSKRLKEAGFQKVFGLVLATSP